MITDLSVSKRVLRTEALSIGYTERGKKNLVQSGLSLDLWEGDFICLIGPNGCGKSTLIRTLGGIQRQISGTIFVDDKDLNTLHYSVRSRYMNTVLTDRTAVDHITVEEIAALGRYAYTNWLGTLLERDHYYIKNSIDQVGLTGFEERMLSTLSDGEKQRAFIAKALASNAPLLLLDEPTAHLDVSNRVEIITLLRNLCFTAGHTCLVSTHDLDLALQLADEIWLMLPKIGIVRSTPEEIIHEGYLGRIFGNDTLYFNVRTGNFALRKKGRHKIRFEVNSKIPGYAHKTFERLGFSEKCLEEPVASIGFDNEGWTITNDNFTFKKLSLSEICRILKKLVKTK
jgi:iron complex transport system ATP-binding protein